MRGDPAASPPSRPLCGVQRASVATAAMARPPIVGGRYERRLMPARRSTSGDTPTWRHAAYEMPWRAL